MKLTSTIFFLLAMSPELFASVPDLNCATTGDLTSVTKIQIMENRMTVKLWEAAFRQRREVLQFELKYTVADTTAAYVYSGIKAEGAVLKV